MAQSPEEIQLTLPLFSGPLGDLLLLVDRQLISPADIPVAEVVRQCLAYSLGDMGQQALLVALCCRLVLAKARALASPPSAPPEPVAAAPDLRRWQEVRTALQPAVAALEALEARGRTSFRRRQMPRRAAEPPSIPPVPLEGLADMARRRLNQLSEGPRPEPDTAVTLQECIQRVREALQTRGRVPFSELMEQCRDRLEVILTFLAVLELLRQGVLDAHQEEAFGEIWIEAL